MFSLNIFRKEMRLSRRSFIIWAGFIVVFIVVYLSFFPYMAVTGVTEMVKNYPEVVRATLNLTEATAQDVNPYHANIVMGYVLLLLSIYAMMLAGGMISKEADMGTAEFLYTRPLTRRQIAVAKIAAFLLMTVLIWAIAFIVSTVVGLAVASEQFDVKLQMVIHLVGLLAAMAAGGIAFAVAPFIDRVQVTTSLGVGIGLAFFFINAISKMTERLDFLKYFSIHYYADLQGAASGEPFLGGMLALVLIFVAGTALGVFFLSRKEFTA